jgi:hypothetical protein
MGVLGRGWIWVVGGLGSLLLALPAHGQTQWRTALPSFGSQAKPQVEDLTPPEFTSAVSLIDNIFPRTQVRMRADVGLHANRPQRAEYIWAKGGFPNTPGPPKAETNVSYQELSSYIEYAVGPWFSFFLEAPTKWVNPTVNNNASGYGDTNVGFKFLTYAGDDLQFTFQLRAYLPTGTKDPVLGTQHMSLEPALLGHYQIVPGLQLEGEVRYWVPMSGTDFSGDVLRYGLGISYGGRGANEMWVMPVLEAVGWTVLSGKTFVPGGPTFTIEDATGDTIVNVQAGVRWGYGERTDVYAGYGRGVSGDKWFRDFFRLEIRYLF